MRSKLEPGCKAIIVGGQLKENIGKIVTCVKYIGALKGWEYSDLWEVDKPVMFTYISNPETGFDFICPASKLQRIDDDSNPETEEIKEKSNTEVKQP